jgi:hypothetical protein
MYLYKRDREMLGKEILNKLIPAFRDILMQINRQLLRWLWL